MCGKHINFFDKKDINEYINKISFNLSHKEFQVPHIYSTHSL